MNVATADVKSGGLESKDVIMMPGGVYGRDFFNAHGPNAASQLSRSLFRVTMWNMVPREFQWSL